MSVANEVPRQTLALLPAGIAGSAYSAYAAGDPRMGFRSLNEAVDLAIQFIEAAAGPTYTYLYVSRIDDTVHELGPARLEAVGAVRQHRPRLGDGRIGCEMPSAVGKAVGRDVEHAHDPGRGRWQ